jgi:hypothetical protein
VNKMKGNPPPPQAHPSYPTIASIICGPNLTIGVSHRGLAIYIQKYVKGKRRIMKTQNIAPCKKYNLKKKSSKRNQFNPSSYYYNSIITNLKFQHKPKIYHLSRILI